MAEDKELEDFENRCLKSQSNNIFICPKKIRQRKRNKLIEFVNRKMSTHKCCKAKRRAGKGKGKEEEKMAAIMVMTLMMLMKGIQQWSGIQGYIIDELKDVS